jgi:hypothetical protein
MIRNTKRVLRGSRQRSVKKQAKEYTYMWKKGTMSEQRRRQRKHEEE